MSLLTATTDDTKSGRGTPLPNRVWHTTVLEAAAEVKATGKQIKLVLGNFRDEQNNIEVVLSNGVIYRPGNRKVFDRQWYEQNNPQAQKIGLRTIKQMAMSAGLMEKPTAEAPSELNFDSYEDFAAALIGREVTVKTKQVTRLDADGRIVKDEDGLPIVDSEVAYYVVPK